MSAIAEVPKNIEPWVDMQELARHLGQSYQTTYRMVKDGHIPGFARRSGKRIYWRFKLSVVDAAFSEQPGNPQAANQ